MHLRIRVDNLQACPWRSHDVILSDPDEGASMARIVGTGNEVPFVYGILVHMGAGKSTLPVEGDGCARWRALVLPTPGHLGAAATSPKRSTPRLA